MNRYVLAGLLVCAIVFQIRASDGRVPIYQGTTISEPGSYYFTRDLTDYSEITISSGNVTLDLNEHYLNGPIQVTGAYSSIRICDGRIDGSISFPDGGSGLIIEGITSTGTGFLTVGGGVDDFLIRNNSGDSIQLSGAFSGEISDNRVREIVIAGQNVTVRGNEMKGGLNGVVLTGSSLVSVKDNIIESSGFGIKISHSDTCPVEGNSISGSGDGGVYLDTVDSCRIAGNELYNNGNSSSAAAIKVLLSATCEVSGNLVSYGWGDGLSVEDSIDTGIKDNLITGFDENGVEIYGGSERAVVDGNTVYSCQGCGFSFDAATTGITYSNNRSTANTLGDYNDLGANLNVCYDGPACSAPTNH